MYFDKAGTFRFETLDHWLTNTDSQSSQGTLSADRWWHLGQDEGWGNAYTGIEIGYTPRAPRPIRVVYEAHETFILQPGETRTIWAPFDVPCEDVFDLVANTDYQARGAGNLNLNDYLSLTETAYAQRAKLEVENTHTTQALYLINLQIRGLAVEADETYEEKVDADDAVLTTWWRGADADAKVLRESGNPYLQTRHQALRRAGVMRDRLQVPRKLLQVRAAACPFLEYGDLVTVQHEASELDVEGIVLGIGIQWGFDTGYQGAYTILPTDDLFSAEPYFIVGTSEYDTPSEAVFW